MRKALAALAASFMLPTAATPPAHADYDPGCIAGPAMYGLRKVNRSICDGPILPDGSWWRSRRFYAPADYNVWYTPTFGFEGAPIPELVVQDKYQVWPDAIPFGEMGHIDEGVSIP